MIPSSSNFEVLIIDSSKEATESLSKFFHSMGIKSQTTNDSMEGLLKIRENNFDAIILDIDMSVISGLGIVEFLAGEDILKNQNIFIFSKEKIPEVKLQYLLRKEGIKGIFKKSIDYDELLMVIYPEFSQKHGSRDEHAKTIR